MHAATRKRNDLVYCKMLEETVMTVMLIKFDGVDARSFVLR